MKKDLLTIGDLTAEQVEELFARALELKNGEKSTALAGKSIAMIFEKSSTRTRVSFEVGVFQLGGQSLFMSSGTTQMNRGEPIKDTARTLSGYCHGIVYRAFSQQDMEEMAEWARIPLINALSDRYHPCQILTDLFTLYELDRETWKSKKIAWIGDGNNMANSYIVAANLLDLELSLAVPPGYEPLPSLMDQAKKLGRKVSLYTSPEEAVADADVVCTDVWASMGDEEEVEQRHKAFSSFVVDQKLMKQAAPKAHFMHCLPAHRGEEVTDSVIEGECSIVFTQAENRLHLQKALMELLMG
jgi:ornithine carbamoyltransferase